MSALISLPSPELVNKLFQNLRFFLGRRGLRYSEDPDSSMDYPPLRRTSEAASEVLKQVQRFFRRFRPARIMPNPQESSRLEGSGTTDPSIAAGAEDGNDCP